VGTKSVLRRGTLIAAWASTGSVAISRLRWKGRGAPGRHSHAARGNEGKFEISLTAASSSANPLISFYYGMLPEHHRCRSDFSNWRRLLGNHEKKWSDFAAAPFRNRMVYQAGQADTLGLRRAIFGATVFSNNRSSRARRRTGKAW
jgi:hypothetical protein